MHPATNKRFEEKGGGAIKLGAYGGRQFASAGGWAIGEAGRCFLLAGVEVGVADVKRGDVAVVKRPRRISAFLRRLLRIRLQGT